MGTTRLNIEYCVTHKTPYWYIHADGYWYTYLPDGTLARALSEETIKSYAENTDEEIAKEERRITDLRQSASFMWQTVRENITG